MSRSTFKDECCGIYMIKNLVNSKIYIGQSVRIKQRWHDHRKHLRAGNHYNIHLQSAWNKYGEDNFEFSIVKICPEEELDDLEIYYVDYYNSMNKNYGYNMNSGGSQFRDITEEIREKLRISGTGKNNPNSKPVISLEDNKIYESINMAATQLGLQPATIYRVCTLKKYTTGGKHWMYLKDYENATKEYIDELLKKKDPGLTKHVIYLNSGVIYNSIKEASADTGVNANSISQCCLGDRPRAGVTEDGVPRIFRYYTKQL